MNLQDIQNLVVEKYRFDTKTYPELEGADDSQIDAFAIRHSALHMMKSVGEIAAYAEAEDHGKPIPIGRVEEAVWKQFINVLRLADIVGMDAQTLTQKIVEHYQGRE